MTKEDEKYCLEELSRGNKQAYEWLFLTWHSRLVTFFTRFLGDGDAAYDYAQDVFFDIWISRKKFSDVESFSAYLFQMARFKIYNHFDKAAVKSRFRGDVLARDSRLDASKESAIYANEMETLIWQTVMKLPAKRREVFIMSRFQGYTNEEISEKLGISKRTVENHITSVLATLRKVVKVIIVLCVSGLKVYF